MKKLYKKVFPVICALSLMSAYPVTGLENKVDDYEGVKKIKIIHSVTKEFNDDSLESEDKYIQIEKTYKDDKTLTEVDLGIDGVIDATVMKYKKVYNQDGCVTTVIEEDVGNDGKMDYRETHKHMLGGSITEIDLDADGEVDGIITEMLCSGGVIIKEYDLNADGIVGQREKKTYTSSGVVTEYDIFADGFIDYIVTEKTLEDGGKVVETKYYNKNGGEAVEILTEEVLPDGTRLKETDFDNDGTIDYREREKVTRISPIFTTKLHEVERKGDGKVTYQNIEEILEIEIP